MLKQHCENGAGKISCDGLKHMAPQVKLPVGAGKLFYVYCLPAFSAGNRWTFICYLAGYWSQRFWDQLP